MSSGRSNVYDLHFESRPGFMHITVAGVRSPETFAQYTAEIIGGCELKGCDRILIEDRLVGPRMSPLDYYSVLPTVSQRARSVIRAIALVDEQIGDVGYFAETVAVNRGLNIGVFTTLKDAENWLLGEAGRPVAS